MIEPTRLPRLLQELESWLPVDPDALLRFVTGVLANLEVRVSQLIVSPDRELAAGVVSLLDGWRFAAPPSKLDYFALRRVPPSVRVVQVVDDRHRITPATRAALQELSASTPIVMAEGKQRRALRAALPWLFSPFDQSIDDETRAARLRFADRARRAFRSFLDLAIESRADLEQLEVDVDDTARMAAIAAIVEAAEGRRDAATLAPQLVAIIRQRAFLAGRLRVTPHDVRFGIGVALAQLDPLTREAIAFAADRIADEWRLWDFVGDRSDTRSAKLSDLAERGLLIRQGELGQVVTYRAADALKTLLI